MDEGTNASLGGSAGLNGEARGERREHLLASLERDREQVRRAVEDLRRSANGAMRSLSLGRELLTHPAVWLVGGLALGVWLGRRSTARDL
jgi:hypothetical protein